MEHDYDRLLLLCDRSSNLPPLPASVFRLMEAIDNSGASASQLAQITAADPMLCAKILRAANSQGGVNGLAQISSIQGAILRLGHQAVRSIAISLSVQATFAVKREGCAFDPLCFARHSVLVGLVARYVYARRLKDKPAAANLSPEEVFAGGVLHDLPIGILAFVVPDAYETVFAKCKAERLSAERGFELAFNGSLREFGGRVMLAWQMPESLGLAVEFAAYPAHAPSDILAFQAICYANAVVDRRASETEDLTYSPWAYDVQMPADVEFEVALDQEELNLVLPKLTEQVEFYLPSRIMTLPTIGTARRTA